MHNTTLQMRRKGRPNQNKKRKEMVSARACAGACTCVFVCMCACVAPPLPPPRSPPPSPPRQPAAPIAAPTATRAGTPCTASGFRTHHHSRHAYRRIEPTTSSCALLPATTEPTTTVTIPIGMATATTSPTATSTTTTSTSTSTSAHMCRSVPIRATIYAHTCTCALVPPPALCNYRLETHVAFHFPCALVSVARTYRTLIGPR